MNVPVTRLAPGVFGVSHGSGIAGDLIRSVTGSWAGHAFLYLGSGKIISGQPLAAVIEDAGTYGDAIWAWRMWDQLQAAAGWDSARVRAAQASVTARGYAEAGCGYDYPAYVGFALEVLKLRSEQQLAPDFALDHWRVCSALVADALEAGGVPLDFVPEDGPGLVKDPGTKALMPPNLVAPGMLLGLAQRLDWA